MGRPKKPERRDRQLNISFTTAEYRALLDTQKAARAELIDRQEQGFISPHLVQPSPGRATPPIAPEASPSSSTGSSPSVPLPATSAWTAKAGMVAQQQSANRWLDRTVERLGRTAVAPQPDPGRSRLAMAQDRLRGEKVRPDKSVTAPGIEPDR